MEGGLIGVPYMSCLWMPFPCRGVEAVEDIVYTDRCFLRRGSGGM